MWSAFILLSLFTVWYLFRLYVYFFVEYTLEHPDIFITGKYFGDNLEFVGVVYGLLCLWIIGRFLHEYTDYYVLPPSVLSWLSNNETRRAERVFVFTLFLPFLGYGEDAEHDDFGTPNQDGDQSSQN